MKLTLKKRDRGDMLFLFCNIMQLGLGGWLGATDCNEELPPPPMWPAFGS